MKSLLVVLAILVPRVLPAQGQCSRWCLFRMTSTEKSIALGGLLGFLGGVVGAVVDDR